MEKTSLGGKVFIMIRALLVAYVVTALLLLLMAFMLFKFEWDESKVAIGMIAVYVISCFLGGFAAGKGGQSRRFLWGLLTGTLYFLILVLVSLGFGGSNAFSMATTGALCLGGGMIGGMLA